MYGAIVSSFAERDPVIGPFSATEFSTAQDDTAAFALPLARLGCVCSALAGAGALGPGATAPSASVRADPSLSRKNLTTLALWRPRFASAGSTIDAWLPAGRPSLP